MKKHAISLFYFLSFLFLIVTLSHSISHLHPFLELSIHFKFQFLSIACVMVMLMFLLRSYLVAVALMIPVVFLSLDVIPWYLEPRAKMHSRGDSSQLQTEMATQAPLNFSVLLSNVLGSNTHYSLFTDYVRRISPDIVVMIEVDKDWELATQNLKLTYPYHHIKAQENNFGLSILSKFPITQIEEKHFGLPGMPSLIAKIEVADKNPIQLIATHPVPPVSTHFSQVRDLQLTGISQYISDSNHSQHPTPTLLVGDLNITMWAKAYQQLEKQTHLTNARKGFGLIPTWPSHWPIFGIPIDHCLVSPEFKVVDVYSGENIGSDHLPLVTHLSLNQTAEFQQTPAVTDNYAAQ